MKAILICESISGNTLKVAQAINDELTGNNIDSKIIKPDEIDKEKILDYDLIGFGTGIYYMRMQKSILQLAKSMKENDKKVFIFYTSGFGWKIYSYFLKKILQKKGSKLLGVFQCKAFDTFGPLKLFPGGGLNKDRPNNEDLEDARLFTRKLIL
jgi:flavodoxin